MSTAHSISLEEAAKRVLAGEVVAYPTETFFGLAVLPDRPAAVEQLIVLKSRLDGAGVSLIIDSADYVEKVIAREERAVRDARLLLQERFWPGPLTMVVATDVRMQSTLAPQIFGPDQTLALRVSPHPAAAALAKAAGGAITATSANPKGLPPPEVASLVREYFPELPIFDPLLETLKGDKSMSASTILDVTALPFSVLRVGALAPAELTRFVAIA